MVCKMGYCSTALRQASLANAKLKLKPLAMLRHLYLLGSPVCRGLCSQGWPVRSGIKVLELFALTKKRSSKDAESAMAFFPTIFPDADQPCPPCVATMLCTPASG